MHPVQNFQFVTHNNINKEQWDNCVANAANSLVYAQSFYLNKMCPGWDALIGLDYKWVWPIVSRKKYGIAYLYQPHFTQQLGPFFLPGVEMDNWHPAIEVLQKQFIFWELNINFNIDAALFKPPFELVSGTNLVLPLNPAFNQLEKNFSNDLTRNVKQAIRSRMEYTTCTDHTLALQTYHMQYKSRMPQLTTANFHQWAGLMTAAALKGMVLCRKVVDQDNGLMAIALFLNDGRRLYNIMNSTTEAGRKSSANHLLLHQLIAEFAGSDLLLDFEGSDLPGVKAFYQNFGGENQPYLKVKYNALPWPLRLFKR